MRLKKELKTRKNLNSFGKNSHNTKNTLLKTVNKFSKKASKILKISEDIFLKYIEKIPQNKSNVFTCKQHLTRPLKYHLPKLKKEPLKHTVCSFYKISLIKILNERILRKSHPHAHTPPTHTYTASAFAKNRRCKNVCQCHKSN